MELEKLTENMDNIELKPGYYKERIKKIKDDPNNKSEIVCYWSRSTACFKCCEYEGTRRISCWYETCDV